MANEIRQYTLTIPAGTTQAAPQVLDCTFPPRKVEALQVIVPPGPSGLVGWQVRNSGVKLIPYAPDDWIITAGENISWPLDGQIESGSWQVAGYNTGTIAHSVYFRFLLNWLTPRTPVTPPMLDDALLSSTAPTIDVTEGMG